MSNRPPRERIRYINLPHGYDFWRRNLWRVAETRVQTKLENAVHCTFVHQCSRRTWRAVYFGLRVKKLYSESGVYVLQVQKLYSESGFFRSGSTNNVLRERFICSWSTKNVLQERVLRSSVYLRGTPKTCTAFFSVPSRYIKKPCFVLKIIQFYSKNVLRSLTFLFVFQEHVPRSSVYPRGTAKKCTALFSVPSRYTENPFCVLRTINLYSKNVYPRSSTDKFVLQENILRSSTIQFVLHESVPPFFN